MYSAYVHGVFSSISVQQIKTLYGAFKAELCIQGVVEVESPGESSIMASLLNHTWRGCSLHASLCSTSAIGYLRGTECALSLLIHTGNCSSFAKSVYSQDCKEDIIPRPYTDVQWVGGYLCTSARWSTVKLYIPRSWQVLSNGRSNYEASGS